MDTQLRLRIILENPPPGVDFGLQLGAGNNYQTVQKQRSGTGNLVFNVEAKIKEDKTRHPDFFGSHIYGTSGERFIYIDIGKAAGQASSIWQRRLKVPLRDITWDGINEVLADDKLVLETRVPGTGRDGGPNCATVKPFAGWQVVTVK